MEIEKSFATKEYKRFNLTRLEYEKQKVDGEFEKIAKQIENRKKKHIIG